MNQGNGQQVLPRRRGARIDLRDRRVVLIGLALVALALFGAGMGYWIAFGQHHLLCADGRPPVAQQDQGLGQVIYRCHNGEVVTGSILP